MSARFVVFDTETTGRSPAEGDRIVEIGCVELIGRERGERHVHLYLNPEREVPAEVVQIHGLTGAFLADKPRFRDPGVAERILDFFGDDPLIAHNAAFDRDFLNAELVRAGRSPIPAERFIDTVPMARKRWPGQRASLDALALRCNLQKAGFDLTARKGPGGHGALLDAKMLAEIYVELIGGREQGLALEPEASAAAGGEPHIVGRPIVRGERRRPRPVPLGPLSTPQERAAHRAFVETLGANALWRALNAGERGE